MSRENNYGVIKYESNENASRGILIAEGEYPWQAVLDMVPTTRFGRTIDVAREYRAHLDRVDTEWDNIASYCLHTFLGYPIEEKVVNDIKVKCVDQNYTSDKECVILENSFPYSLERGILHKVVWSVEDMSRDQVVEFARKEYPENLFDIVIFVNPNSMKSITKPYHMQVFVMPTK